jgi:hypothetical protein
VLTVGLPAVHVMLADRLVYRLTGDDEGVRQRAAASLVELGGAVSEALVVRLFKTRDEGLRGRLTEVLNRIAAKVPEAEGGRIMMNLFIAQGMAATPHWRRGRRRKRRHPGMAQDCPD